MKVAWHIGRDLRDKQHPEDIKLFCMLKLAEHKSFSAINMKMPTIVFRFISRVMGILSYI